MCAINLGHMINLSHRTLIVISGAVWLLIGCWLLQLGLNFIVEGGLPELAKIGIITLALLIGYLKGKKVLGKSAQKGIQRIYSLSNPASITKIYKPSYYLLLGSMVGIGFLAKFLPLDLRGFIDTTIGAALINGSMVYFKACYTPKISNS